MYRESIRNLMEANKEEPDVLDFIESRVNSFVDYVAHVNFMEVRIQRLTIEGIDGEAWRDAVESLDHRRRDKHEVAMNAVNQLNRLCTASDLPLFYDGPVDHEHRNEVGDMIGQVVSEYFNDRNTRPLTITDMMKEESGKEFAAAVADLGTENQTTMEQ